nr:hypothetical protein [Sneathiella glossodoripedis]
MNAEVVDGEGRAGELLDNELTVACGHGALKLTLLQRSGKSPMAMKAFVNGFPLPKGSRLG